MEVFWEAPPIIRTITAAVVAESILVYAGILNFRHIIFYYPWILKFPPQIWRLATPFLLTGPQMSIILDPYFLYTYGKALETSSPRFSRRGDFFVYIVFVCTVIAALAGVYLNGITFLDALILAFAYTFAHENTGSKVGLFVFTIPAGFLPYALLAMTFVMAGPDAAKKQGTGLIAAHLYDFLTRIWPTFGGGSNWLPTPFFVSKWFGDDTPNVTARGAGTAFVPGVARPQAPSARQQPSSAFTTSSSWTSRGSGRRLGGD